MFNAMDLNGDGSIQVEEVRSFLNRMAEPLKLTQISNEEFKILMDKLIKKNDHGHY